MFSFLYIFCFNFRSVFIVLISILLNIGNEMCYLCFNFWCNLGVIVVRVFEPVFRNLFQSYTWPLKNWTHSYTRSTEMLPIHILTFDILYQFIAGS